MEGLGHLVGFGTGLWEIATAQAYIGPPRRQETFLTAGRPRTRTFNMRLRRFFLSFSSAVFAVVLCETLVTSRKPSLSNEGLKFRYDCISRYFSGTTPTPEIHKFIVSQKLPKRWLQSSHVYYWRMLSTGDKRCKRWQEKAGAAKCTAEKIREINGRRVLVTFGDRTRKGGGIRGEERLRNAEWIAESAIKSSNADEAFSYKLRDIERSIFTEHSKLFNNARVFNMLAKVYFLHRLAEIKPLGTLLLWIDSDIVPPQNSSLGIFWCLAINSASGVVPFPAYNQPYMEKWYTKQDVLRHFGMHNDRNALDTLQILTGVVAFRVTKYTRLFLNEWFVLCTKPNLMLRDKPSKLAPEISDFGSHKEDQSIFSMMVKRDCLKSYPYPDYHRDTSDIYSIEAGYCDSGVDPEVMINTPEHQRRSIETYRNASFLVRNRWLVPDALNNYLGHWYY